MPAIGAGLSDQEVARVADYVRNSFGNAAPASADPTEVAKLHTETHTPMAAARLEDCAKPPSQRFRRPSAVVSSIGLAGSEPVDLLPALDALIEKLKPVAEKTPDLVVFDLTAAYCPVLFEEAEGHSAAARRQARPLRDARLQPRSDAGPQQLRARSEPAVRHGSRSGAAGRQGFAASARARARAGRRIGGTLPARVIHEVLREEGEVELRRPVGALIWSGLAAGSLDGLLVPHHGDPEEGLAGQAFEEASRRSAMRSAS